LKHDDELGLAQLLGSRALAFSNCAIFLAAPM
jgi:hypothetical protein